MAEHAINPDWLDLAALTGAPASFAILRDFVASLAEGRPWEAARSLTLWAWDGGCEPVELALALPMAPANDRAAP